MKVAEIFESMEYGPAAESADPAIEFLEKHSRKFGLFIDGKWKKPNSKSYVTSFNPSTNQKLAEISEADEKDVKDAVSAAKKALQEWVGIGGHARARYLYALARQIQKYSRAFAVLESMDNGKPIREFTLIR